MGLGLDRALVGLQVFWASIPNAQILHPFITLFDFSPKSLCILKAKASSDGYRSSWLLQDGRSDCRAKSCLRRPAKHAAPHPHPVQSNPVPHSTRLPGNHRLHRHQVQAPNLRLEPDRPRTPRSSSSGRRFPSPLTSRTWVLLALLRKKWK
ncbi:WRKY transcription factor 11 [Pyrus ussuriensis x Pyrus communis]|uniref:WRKY transcription factor 11 n=1 Tax=Pyrus ussuriensis x Pyrus communis TaxID=2448454 RepID=A0A5N5FSM4_9ROSA|nr:WRKY transcription factor 11 [Pyrus ussuriensis x Pyrus communis]